VLHSTTAELHPQYEEFKDKGPGSVHHSKLPNPVAANSYNNWNKQDALSIS